MANIHLSGKTMRKDLRHYHFALLFNRQKAQKIRLEAAKKIHFFNTGHIEILPRDADMMYTYLRTFGHMKNHVVTDDAYNSFIRLNWLTHKERPGIFRRFQAGIYNLGSIITRRIAKLQRRYDTIIYTPGKNTVATPAAKQSQRISRSSGKNNFFRRHQSKIIGLFVVAGVLFGAGKCAKSTQNDKQTDKVETIKPTASVTQNTDKTFEVKANDSVADTLTRIYKNYYDTALEIHLGTAKRDQLYADLTGQLNTGRLTLPQGETMEHLAHTITVASLVQPNASTTKLLKKAVNGELTPQEQQSVWSFVSQAGDKGQHIKGTGTHSNFDRQKVHLQKKHVKNLKQLQKYKARTGR